MTHLNEQEANAFIAIVKRLPKDSCVPLWRIIGKNGRGVNRMLRNKKIPNYSIANLVAVLNDEEHAASIALLSRMFKSKVY